MNHIFYYINLERSVENNEKMIQKMKEHNINFERIEGHDFKNSLPKYEIKNAMVEPTPKEMAITLSHFKVLETFIESKYEIAIVSEDDVSFKYIPDFNKKIEEILVKVPENWGYIGLHCNNKYTNENNIESFKNNILFRKIDQKNIMKDNSAVLYVINKNTAKNIITKYKLNDKYIFDYQNKYPSIVLIIRSQPESYFYTEPIICVNDNNINTLGISHPLDYMTNKIIKEFWGY